MAADGPVFSSYVEAYLAGSKATPSAGYPDSASTETYGYGPAGSTQRLRKPKNFVEGSPLPTKPFSVLWRPTKPPSAKNTENLDVQHERDKDAFERRANSYRRLAQNSYHHNAPPGSILTTFEQGHIVDRGRGRGDVQEARGVYDPVNHSYRIPPAPSAAKERPSSAPHGRGYAAIHAAQQPPHERSPTPTAAKQLQVSRGIYNPLTHEYKELPEPEYAGRREKEFQRAHGIGHGMRRIQPFEPSDPITWRSPEQQPAAAAASSPPPSSPPPASAAAADAQSSTSPTMSKAAQPAAREQRPVSAPGRGRGVRKSMQGPSWGTYNPLTHEWQVPPENSKFLQQEALVERQLGVSGHSAARTQTPRTQGVYNPILNTWTVPPADSRVIDGLSFMPATLFSRPTAATIRM